MGLFIVESMGLFIVESMRLSIVESSESYVNTRIKTQSFWNTHLVVIDFNEICEMQSFTNKVGEIKAIEYIHVTKS
jgi:hypothetical protein